MNEETYWDNGGGVWRCYACDGLVSRGGHACQDDEYWEWMMDTWDRLESKAYRFITWGALERRDTKDYLLRALRSFRKHIEGRDELADWDKMIGKVEARAEKERDGEC